MHFCLISQFAASMKQTSISMPMRIKTRTEQKIQQKIIKHWENERITWQTYIGIGKLAKLKKNVIGHT